MGAVDLTQQHCTTAGEEGLDSPAACGLKLLAHTLVQLAAQLQLRLETFSLGSTSGLLGNACLSAPTRVLCSPRVRQSDFGMKNAEALTQSGRRARGLVVQSGLKPFRIIFVHTLISAPWGWSKSSC